MSKHNEVKNFIEMNKNVSRNVKKRGRDEISDFESTNFQNRVKKEVYAQKYPDYLL